MQELIVIIVLLFLGFIGFVIYFIFKILQFLVQAINLYKKMITRQDMMIKLLKNRKVDCNANTDTEIEDIVTDSTDSDKQEAVYCTNCGTKLGPGSTDCKWCNSEKLKIHMENKYDMLKDKIINEVRSKLKTEEEITYIETFAGLSYSEINDLAADPNKLNKKSLYVFKLFISEMKSAFSTKEP